MHSGYHDGMLKELDITDIGPIKHADMEFHKGMTVITGETGTGKSMLLAGIGALTGGITGKRGGNGVITAIMSGLPSNDAIPDTTEDDGSTIITRRRNGRFTANGAIIPAGTIHSIMGESLIIHGQSDQIRLTSPASQLRILDDYADDGGILERYATAHHEVMRLKAIIGRSRGDDSIERMDYLESAMNRIRDADIHDGELESLKTRARMMEEYEARRESNENTMECLTQARALLASVMGQDDGIMTAMGIIDDIMGRMAINDGMMDDEDMDIDSINERMTIINGILRRFGGTEASALEWLSKSETEWEALHMALEDSDRINGLLSDAITTENAIAGELHDRRVDAASGLSESVNRELAGLNMPSARFAIDVHESQPNDKGHDTVSFLISTFDGAPMGALGRVASGGELSRIMLAVELSASGHTHGAMPTFVFDEVDAGVGGRAGIALGRRLAMLSRHAQVIVVTHLPQIAAYADAHLMVARDGSLTTIRPVNGHDRTMEIARMLAGGTDEEALRHAESLLLTSTVE